MSPRTRTRAAIAMLVTMMANAVLFGAGIIAMLLLSGANAAIWIPVVAALSVILAFPIGWEIAPRMRLSHAQHGRQPASLRTQHYAGH